MDKYQNVCYPSLEEKAMKKSTRWAAVLFAVLFVVYGILSKTFYAWFAGLLLFVVMLYEKQLCVTGQGLVMDSGLLVKLYREVWTFGEIESIHRRPAKEPGYVTLVFMKGLSGKQLVFTCENAENIVQMALDINPSIDYQA